MNRRTFIQMTAGAAMASASKPLVAARPQQTGPVGANERVRMAVIGTGNRGNEVMGSFAEAKNANVFVAACDVFKERLDSTVQKMSAGGNKVDGYEEYKRILDRKDVDAVLIATPDHWHPQITMDACAAGKDVYLEKPACNDATIEEAARMIPAARKYNRIVQMGTEQRSWPMFGEARELIPQLGGVTHVVIQQSGGGSPLTEPLVPVPVGLNWDVFQGPARRKAYKAGRQRGWRYYLDYGGGLMTDWGVHWVDTALWFMNAQLEAPKMASGIGQYVNVENPDPDRPHNAFMGSWQYSKFVMSFSNVVMGGSGVLGQWRDLLRPARIARHQPQRLHAACLGWRPRTRGRSGRGRAGRRRPRRSSRWAGAGDGRRGRRWPWRTRWRRRRAFGRRSGAAAGSAASRGEAGACGRRQRDGDVHDAARRELPRVREVAAEAGVGHRDRVLCHAAVRAGAPLDA